MQQQVEKEANPTNSRLPYVCDNTNRTYLLHVIMTKPQPAFFSWWGTGGHLSVTYDEEKAVVFLATFLYRNLKGFRFLVILAILVTFAQVGSDLLAALPLKFIPSKINNPGSDPACTFPFLDRFLDRFDTPWLDPLLQPLQPGQPPKQPPLLHCPISSNPGMLTHHSVIGVIVFSVLMLIMFGILSAILAYIQLYLAAFIAQNLTARLRGQLFEHLERLSLDWHGKQKKGDLVQRVTGNIADIEKLVTDGLGDRLGGILMLVRI